MIKRNNLIFGGGNTQLQLQAVIFCPGFWIVEEPVLLLWNITMYSDYIIILLEHQCRTCCLRIDFLCSFARIPFVTKNPGNADSAIPVRTSIDSEFDLKPCNVPVHSNANKKNKRGGKNSYPRRRERTEAFAIAGGALRQRVLDRMKMGKM
jgi:hypothetical protein